MSWPGSKWAYLYVVQGDLGEGWEDLTASEESTEMIAVLKGYRRNDRNHAYRMIHRRVPREEDGAGRAGIEVQGLATAIELKLAAYEGRLRDTDARLAALEELTDRQGEQIAWLEQRA